MDKNNKISNAKKEGMHNLDIEHAKKIHELVELMLKKRGEELDAKAKTNVGKYVELEKPQSGFGFKGFFLKAGCFSVGSDFHGDYFSLYAFLVQSGYLIPVENRFLVCSLIIDENKKEFEYKILLEDELKSIKSNKDTFAIMPGFDVNTNFEGGIKLLGDYVDRGSESLMCLLLLDYLTKEQKKRAKKEIKPKISLCVLYGNHESTCPDGLYNGNYDKSKDDDALKEMKILARSLINNMRSERRMTFSSLEIINNIPVSFSHTAMCKLHIYKILGIIKILYKIIYFEEVKVAERGCIYLPDEKDIKVDDNEHLKCIKERFLKLKSKEEYKSLFEVIEKKLDIKEVKNCKTMNKLLEEYLKENSISLSDNGDDNRYYRYILLDCLVSAAKKDNELKKDNEVVHKLLKEEFFLFKDEDYFKLRDFIARVVPPGVYLRLIQEVGDPFYDTYYDDIDEDYAYEFYFRGIENGSDTAFYWPVEERFIVPMEKSLNVWQFVGHDRLQSCYVPYIRNKINPGGFNINKDFLVMCVDTGRSFAYDNKSYAMMLAVTSNSKLILESFSVSRDKDFKILLDTVKRERSFIAIVEDIGKATEMIEEKNGVSGKQFYSPKHFLSAFGFNVEVSNKPVEIVDNEKDENDIKSSSMKVDKSQVKNDIASQKQDIKPENEVFIDKTVKTEQTKLDIKGENEISEKWFDEISFSDSIFPFDKFGFIDKLNLFKSEDSFDFTLPPHPGKFNYGITDETESDKLSMLGKGLINKKRAGEKIEENKIDREKKTRMLFGVKKDVKKKDLTMKDDKKYDKKIGENKNNKEKKPRVLFYVERFDRDEFEHN